MKKAKDGTVLRLSLSGDWFTVMVTRGVRWRQAHKRAAGGCVPTPREDRHREMARILHRF